MGLIQAFKGSVSGELANQWKELFVSDSMSSETLVKRAEHKVSGRSTNKKGDSDVITKGSAIIVNEGQCALLVDSGKIIDVAAEAGAYEWDESGSASIFAGDFANVFKELGRRFTFGGEKPVQPFTVFPAELFRFLTVNRPASAAIVHNVSFPCSSGKVRPVDLCHAALCLKYGILSFKTVNNSSYGHLPLLSVPTESSSPSEKGLYCKP